MSTEDPVVFECKGDKLVGILHHGAPDAQLGVVIVVGGPQYRVGSHRQFVLTARQLAESGIPVLRYDYRGMGDSGGRNRTFDSINEDIRVAIDTLQASLSNIRKIIIYALCDAASASLIYGWKDERVAGQVLLNPWVRTEAGEAKSYLKYYYVQRVFQKAFWKKMISGRLDLARSSREFLATWLKSSRNRRLKKPAEVDFIDRMHEGMREFTGSVLVIASGRDLTAQEFVEMCRTDRKWSKCVKRKNVSIEHLPTADHTFSNSDRLADSVIMVKDWIRTTFE